MSTFLWVVGGIFGLCAVAMLLLVGMFGLFNSPTMNGAQAINKELSNQYYWQKGKAVYVLGGNFFFAGK